MPNIAVLTDADACLPDTLRVRLGILTAPLDPAPFVETEEARELRRAQAPVTPPGAIEAAARAMAQAPGVLYVGAGDEYGGGAELLDQVRAVVSMAPMRRAFALHASEAALMGCGWQAVAAAEAIEAGADLGAAVAAAEAVRGRVRVLAMLEHPQWVGVDDVMPGQVAPGRVVVGLRGAEVAVTGRAPRRDLGLQMLRGQFAGLARADAGGELRVAVHHAGTLPAAEAMAEWIRRNLAPAEVHLAPLTRHAATRLGPGMLGLAWYRRGKV